MEDKSFVSILWNPFGNLRAMVSLLEWLIHRSQSLIGRDKLLFATRTRLRGTISSHHLCAPILLQLPPSAEKGNQERWTKSRMEREETFQS